MNDDFSFMKEKIKEKPFYKKKWVQIAVATVASAVLFGAIAGFSFMKICTWIEVRQKDQARQEIEIPQDSVEEITDGESSSEEQAAVQPETIVVENEMTLDDYELLYTQLQGVANEAEKFMVTVTAVSNDVDWFNEGYENRGQSSGMIIGDNGVELLILTKYSTVESYDGINVTFVDDTIVKAALKKYDVTTDFAVISVNLSDISHLTNEKIKKAVLGNSKRLEPGTPVLAVGRADGNEDSVKIGSLTSTRSTQSVVDAEYTVLITDMIKNHGSDGVLINLKGEVVGIVQNQHLSANMENVVSAYGISDIKSLMEHLSNNQDIAYLGIKAVTVTEEATKSGIPRGVYVMEVEIDSPAMLGGIQCGDVIQAINGQKVREMSELSAVLTRLSNKQYITLEGQRLTKDGYKKINYQTSLSVLE